MSTAIEVNNVSKVYQLGQFNTGTIGTDLQRWWALQRGKEDPFLKIGETNDRSKKGESNFVWSLKDVDFKVEQGETVGIIGKNGAGKSTLLKILSQITGPTQGSVKLKGRVASLLEVGTGFHPELTGRDNIFLNGAIFGMRKKEIEKKFDEIVEFSGVGRYIDTPVKRYSSGMYVRLAFAVAAHLESEILIVDEVLAVGDAEFQEKCLGKMGDVSNKEGRTVLFVSHNMTAAKQLCKRGVFLEHGSVKMIADMNSVIEQYLYQNKSEKDFSPVKVKEIDAVITNVTLNKDLGGLISPYKPLTVDIEIQGGPNPVPVGVEIMISHEDTTGLVFSSNSKTSKGIQFLLEEGKNKIRCNIKELNLCSGRYRLGIGLSLQMIKYYYYDLDLLNFDVVEVLIPPSLIPTKAAYGHMLLDHEWSKLDPA